MTFHAKIGKGLLAANTFFKAGHLSARAKIGQFIIMYFFSLPLSWSNSLLETTAGLRGACVNRVGSSSSGVGGGKR